MTDNSEKQELKNVFVLGTGRCGTVSFIKACQHMTNWTAAHESNTHRLFQERLDYPGHHIEADNRLSWMLGRLDHVYGDGPLYVHIYRDPMETARSYSRRTWSGGIMRAYAEGIILHKPDIPSSHSAEEYALDMIDVVTANIRCFLKDKSKVMPFPLHRAKQLWPVFWKLIRATGDYEQSLESWDVRHNAS
ncbi:hypothetical protein [Pseudodesulfovibrio senegalensis]|uniref:Sulfotransferase family protein n=1 Tax=Pseudodesulfovibrio senegalensis TaxID=1721087 RepID=A0A6N6N5M0_9BACT|nr:hypothetical protein [Pseudodesulfovibrio senegalensis]KAB1442186.1 hypothetical protein F8A88_06900 [Pseudodesulfovibrio senegalensis]